MKFITRLKLHFQTTRLVEKASRERDRRSRTRFSLSATFRFKTFESKSRSKRSFQITTRVSKRSRISNLNCCRFIRCYWDNLDWFLVLRLLICLSSANISVWFEINRLRSVMIQTNSRDERFDRETLRSREKSSRDRHCLSSSFLSKDDDSTSSSRELERCNDARTDMSLEISKSAMCVQRFDDSLNSAIHIIYRISLRSSSMSKSKDSLLKVLCIRQIVSNVIFTKQIHRVFDDDWARRDSRRALRQSNASRTTR